MRTDADFVEKLSKHDHGVQVVMKRLEDAGLTLEPHAFELPKMSLAADRQFRIDHENMIMPRDFILRTLGGTVHVKVHWVPGKASSSLYRSAAYMLMGNGRYLQIVAGKSLSEYQKMMTWINNFQSEIQVSQPTGIRHIDEIVDAVKACVVRASQ